MADRLAPPPFGGLAVSKSKSLAARTVATSPRRTSVVPFMPRNIASGSRTGAGGSSCGQKSEHASAHPGHIAAALSQIRRKSALAA